MTPNGEPGTTRRALLQACLMATVAAVAEALRPGGEAFGHPVEPPSDRAVRSSWLEAREVVRSGALGPVVWAQGYYPAHDATGERARDRWARHLSPLLLATDLDECPSRVTAVGDAAPTLLIEFASGALVYLAPVTRAAHSTGAVIQGRVARLSVRDDGLRPRLAPDGSAETARRVRTIVALAEASRRTGGLPGDLRG